MLKEFVRRAIVPAVENYFGLSERTIGPFPDDNTFMRSLWQMYQGGNDPLKEPYKNSVWTYAAINTIAKNAAKVPLRLYKRSEPDKPIDKGSIYNLLRNPNPYMTHKVFIEAISIFLSIYGETALLMNRKEITDTPQTIWVLNPSKFEIVFNEKKNIMVGWIYHGTQDVPLKTYEVLLLKYFNPYNDLRGLSPLEPAQLAINNDWYASKYNENFFKQGAKTGGFITVDGELDDKQFNRMINQFEERHQGYERAHRIALLEGGAKFTEAKITQKDMEYIQLKKLSREEIFAAYKVNEVVLGIYEDVQCFHPDSSVLTDSGFIPVADVRVGTMLATLDSKGSMSFEPVTKTYEYDYDGDMYTQKPGSNRIDYMVTPEHKMYGRRKNCRKKSYTTDFVFERISDIGEYSRSNAFVVPRNGTWSGKTLTEYSIDKRKYVGNGSSQGRKETLFPIVPFLKFLGWHLSEGCFREESSFELAISQSKEEGKNKFREDMKGFPYEYREYPNQNRDEVTFVVNGKDLYNYMLGNTGHYGEERKIPRDILELHPDLLIHLFNALIDGDGCKIGKNGATRYDTTSKQLAEDVYELALRLGRTPILYGGMHGIPRRGNRRNKWSVYVPSEKDSLIQPPLKPVKTHYKGKVYCFEVPPYHTVLSRYNGKSIIVSNSYEGIKMSHKAFWEEAMVPHLGYMEDYLNDTLFLQIEHGQLMVKFDLATVGELHDDYKSRVETAKTMNAIGFPINEINKRLQLGMPEFAWGNVWWVPMGMIPADVAMETAENPPPVEPPKEPDNANPDDTGTDEGTDNKPDKDDKKILWQRYLSVQFRIEELFRSKVKKFIFEQRKMVLENIAKDKYPVFDYNKEVAKLQRLMGNLYVEALKIGATMIVEENGGSPLQFRLEHPEVAKYLETRGSLIPSKIMGTIYKGLEKIFSRKEAKELYAESVRILYNSITKRVGTIARTESSSVLVVGRVIQMQRLGCRYHQWVTSRHDASRESHKELDGKTVKIGDSFRDGVTLRYPGDLMAPVSDTVNCRCFTIMVKSK